VVYIVSDDDEDVTNKATHRWDSRGFGTLPQANW